MVLHEQVRCDNESIFYARNIGDRDIIYKMSLNSQILDKIKDKEVYDSQTKLISFESTLNHSAEMTQQFNKSTGK